MFLLQFWHFITGLFGLHVMSMGTFLAALLTKIRHTLS